MSGHKDLKIYRKSYKLALKTYEASKAFPVEERYGMISQIQRSAISISLNIAEGYAKRASQQEFKRFLLMAVGSANEICVLLDFAKDLEYMSEAKYTEMSAEYEELGRMLSAFIKTVGKQI